jgi:chromosome segregation ATPase
MWEMVPIVLSIVLFLITLIIIGTLRRADKQSRKLEIMRQYVGQYISEVKNTETKLHETIADVEGRLSSSRSEMEKLVSQIVQQRENLFAHSEDLEQLQATLVSYRDALNQLKSMTERAETRTRQVKDEVQTVQQVHLTIEQSLTEIAESEEQLTQLQQRLNHAIEQHSARLDEQLETSVAEAKVKIDSLLDDSLNHTDATFQTMITTVQAFLRELNNRTEVLETAVKRLTTVSLESMNTLAEQIEKTKEQLVQRDESLEALGRKREELEELVASLTDKKRALEQQAASVDQEIVEKKQGLKELSDELDLALAERQRILEEEEQKELQRKVQLDDPDLASEVEVEFDDVVPLFTLDDSPEELEAETEMQLKLQEESELEDESDEKRRKRLESIHYELEEDEEEISLDDEED